MITRYAPGTIYLGGTAEKLVINDLAAEEAITPGMLLERHSSTGVNRLRKAATAKAPGTLVATEQSSVGKGIDDAYAANDLVEAVNGKQGDVFYMIIASGANIVFGTKLENAGNGKLRAWTDASQAFNALETVDNSAGPGDARIRVEVM